MSPCTTGESRGDELPKNKQETRSYNRVEGGGVCTGTRQKLHSGLDMVMDPLLSNIWHSMRTIIQCASVCANARFASGSGVALYCPLHHCRSAPLCCFLPGILPSWFTMITTSRVCDVHYESYSPSPQHILNRGCTTQTLRTSTTHPRQSSS